MGERCKLPRRVWDGATAEIEFGAFLPKDVTSGGILLMLFLIIN